MRESEKWKWKVKVKSLSHVPLFATSWTAAYQAPPSMGFSRQEYWSGVPLPSPPDGASGKELACQCKSHESRVRSLGGEYPLEEGMATHPSILCLENPMDRGAWRAMVHRVTKSQTWLKWLSVHTCYESRTKMFLHKKSKYVRWWMC